MSTKLPARLVRDLVCTDGESAAVRATETLDVLIIWPTGYPESEPNRPYTMYGEWRIAEVRGAVMQVKE